MSAAAVYSFSSLRSSSFLFSSHDGQFLSLKTDATFQFIFFSVGVSVNTLSSHTLLSEHMNEKREKAIYLSHIQTIPKKHFVQSLYDIFNNVAAVNFKHKLHSSLCDLHAASDCKYICNNGRCRDYCLPVRNNHVSKNKARQVTAYEYRNRWKWMSKHSRSKWKTTKFPKVFPFVLYCCRFYEVASELARCLSFLFLRELDDAIIMTKDHCQQFCSVLMLFLNMYIHVTNSWVHR